jgi:uridine kinase
VAALHSAGQKLVSYVIAMVQRHALLREVAAAILTLSTPHVLRVGIDGVDGAGKTTFADELAQVLGASGRTLIRASVDTFHYPRAIRYRRGRDAPRGYVQDSYNYPQLQALLLDPLSPGGTGRFRRAAFDHSTDQPVVVPEEQAVPGAILVFDGIFLHRPELRTYWDYSVFLEVAFRVSYARMAHRDGTPADPQAVENHRYLHGQQLYMRAYKPHHCATVRINNDDVTAPYIIATRR